MSVAAIEMHRRRLILIAVLLSMIALVLAARLVQWQVVEHDELRASAEATHSRREVIDPQRGTILDRNGNVLAISMHDQEAVGDPTFFKKAKPARQDEILAAAASILDLPVEQMRRMLEVGEAHYVQLRSSLSITVGTELNDSDAYPAIAAMPRMRRFHPSHGLMAQTLGFANSDGDGIGVEGSYPKYLKGAPGQKLVEGDGYGRGMGKVPVVTPPQNGADITLTLDINIQYKAERALEEALKAERTVTGVVVIMDPRTGEILAMAGRPTFDPDDYMNVPRNWWNNPVVSDAWEPGSIFKILTFAAALDTGKIKPNQTFVDRGTMKFHGITISNRDNKAYGIITPAQALQYSSNVVTVQVAEILSTTTFYTYMQTAFGVGVRTDIDLPGEAEGGIRVPGDSLWNIIDLAAQSYGQGVATTPIQMTAAVAAVANKGVMMRPYVVGSIPGSGELSGGPGPLRRAIRSDTAAILTDMLVSVVETTVTQARVPGYRLAGKTGTALIPPPNGKYDPEDTIASFIGYGPAEDPRFVILVRVDRPKVHKTGAEVAAPVFKSIAQWLLSYLKVPPTDLRAQR